MSENDIDMRMGRRIAVGLCLVLVGGFSQVPEAVAACGGGSWVAGTVDICAGVLGYRDYVYDDYGADTGAATASSTGGLSRPTGDVRYERDVNSADLVALRLSVAGDRLHVSFELNSLFSSDSTVAALAIDTDDDRATGGGPWPGLGVRSDGWEVVRVFEGGNPSTNLIEGDMPRPPGARWRLQAATAIAGGAVMNVAFRGPRETGTWWESVQAAALRGGDISGFGHAVDVADLTGGVTRPAEPLTGVLQRVYESDYTIPPGEGVDYAGVPGHNADGLFGQLFHFLGRYQPYGIYVPQRAAPHGVQFALHGYSANHSSLVRQAGMQRAFGEGLNRIVLVPLGRGPAGFYSSWSERDVLDVLEDVEATYPVDRDRVFMGGYSMGGYGTFRFAALYPDRFAGYISWVGFNGDCFNGTPLQGECSVGAVGNPYDLLGNLTHVPGANLYAAADELVAINQSLVLMNRFRELGNPYVFYLHPAAEHLTLAVLDDWRKEAAYTAGLSLVRDPARVTFRTDPALDVPELGIAHDRAYWVSDMRGREPGYVDVDLTTHGCGGSLARTQPVYGAGIDPVPWVSEGAFHAGEYPLVRGSVLVGAVGNAASLRIDAGRACLGAGLSYVLDTDGAATITLSDGRVISLPSKGRFEGAV